MISQRNPTISSLVVERLNDAEVTQEGCLAQLHECTERLNSEGFIGDQVGLSSRVVREHQLQRMVNQVSGNTGGNTGLLPFPTRTSRR